MQAFADLYAELDGATGTLDKRAALGRYFSTAAPADAVWALWLLTGGKIGGARKRIASTVELRSWLGEESDTPAWLVDASYHQVGDLAETLSLLLPEPSQRADDIPLHVWIEQRLLPVANQAEGVRRALVVQAWRSMDMQARFVFNKLLTGALRVGVSQGLVQHALADMSGLDVALLAQRLIGRWTPEPGFLAWLLSPTLTEADRALPYPFYLASPLEDDPQSLGDIAEWQLEWKWDGIRIQLIRRATDIALWSRGEERLDGRFPEIEQVLQALGRDAVIDGELLAWDVENNQPAPFITLQKRIQRLKPSARILSQIPVRVLAYDLLELDGEDLRGLPLQVRRARLETLLADANDASPDARLVATSPPLTAATWHEAAALRTQSRERGVEGLMLKRRDSVYRVGRKRGDWWKWKIDPLTIDAVLIYAQGGHGRRSTLFTDYTFGLWRDGELLPVAKAYSGLDDKEIARLDHWIRANTTDKFGPVRAVKPHHVFELAFEAVNKSKRHKAGIAVRFPRILRWREDKRAEDADQLATLEALAS